MSSPSASSSKIVEPASSKSWTPQIVLRFYSKFPLVLLPAEEVGVASKPDIPELWIVPPVDESTWASTDPTCLRIQLLFLLRSSSVGFRSWKSADSAPERSLPALHLPSGHLLGTSEIRAWLDREYPLPEETRALNGMPSQEAHTSALAHSQLILSRLLPAHRLLSTPRSTTLHLPYQNELPLPGFLHDLLPGWVVERTQPAGSVGVRRTVKEAVGAVGVLGGLVREHVVGDGWFLGAEEPTPLDALIASHIHPFLQLSIPQGGKSDLVEGARRLREAVEGEKELRVYVERVMRRAEGEGKRLRWQ